MRYLTNYLLTMDNSSILFRNWFFILLITATISSCKNENNEYQDIDTENYTLSVPNDLELTNHLNELTKVQYQNIEEDIYFIVLDEPIRLSTPTLLGYFKLIQNHFREINDDFHVIEYGKTKINSCNAIVFSMYGKDLVDGVYTYYRYAIIEDGKNYYQIMSWSHLQNKKKLIGKMQPIIWSFKSKNSA
jgi:hypothetical protein